jgi:hypothetical protein
MATSYYGSFADVQTIVNVEIPNNATDALINSSLTAADAFISSKLELNHLVEDKTSTVLVQVGTYYAVAETLQAVFSGAEDANPKSDYYLQRALDLFTDYIDAKSDELGLNDPYSSSQSPCGNPGKPPWDQYDPYGRWYR